MVPGEAQKRVVMTHLPLMTIPGVTPIPLRHRQKERQQKNRHRQKKHQKKNQHQRKKHQQKNWLLNRSRSRLKMLVSPSTTTPGDRSRLWLW